MSAANVTPKSTEKTRLDEVVGRLREGSKSWVKLPLADRIAVARRLLDGSLAVAERSVHAACAAKGITLGTPLEGEEWLGGPYTTCRILRQTAEQLETLARTHNTSVGKLSRTLDGRVVEQNYPMNLLDKVMFGALIAETAYEQGVTEEEVREGRAAFYKKPLHEGRVVLILGAGNVNAIPPTDCITKLFNEGKVCVLKMNPVNAYIGPFVEEAFKELIERNWLAVVYGGAEEGGYLCQHPGIDEVHITGSDKTHDLILWGPPGPERAARMARNKPLLDKEITSELGNVSPVIVVPGPWDARSLGFQADNVAGMITNNASFNCNAAKMLITAKGWKDTGLFLDTVAQKAAAVPARNAWYPGAEQRFKFLTEGRKGVKLVGKQEPGKLPWAIVPGLDASDPDERAFRTEPFCSVVSATEVGAAEDPIAFLEQAVNFANEHLWGTLSAAICVHPQTLQDPKAQEALERALVKLRYGAVGVNIWPAFAFALGTTPWGAYPGSTLTNIQSGRGFVHNTPMMERIEKCVIRHPAVAFPKPPYFSTHRTAHVLGRRLTYMEEDASWLHLPGVIWAAVRA